MSHLTTSFSYIRRAPFQALAAVSVLTLTFFVATILAVLTYSSNQILKYFETRPQVIVFLKDGVGDADVEGLKEQLANDARVKNLSYVSKEDALGIYKEATADNPLLGELVSPSIFPASLEFSVSDLAFTEEVVNEIRDNEIVDTVSFTANLGSDGSLGDVITRLKSVTYYVRLGGVVVVAALAVTSFLVLMVVIGMRIATRKKEIESLSLIGATGWFIKAPILLEAVNYAVAGVIFGWLLAAVLLLYATPSILDYFGEIPVLPRDSMSFFAILGAVLGVELLIGILLASLGSLAAVGRSLRMVK